MKTLIMTIFVMFTGSAYAGECKKVEGCDRIVSLKKGKEKSYSHETHVVVKRATKCDLKLLEAEKEIVALKAKIAALEAAQRKPIQVAPVVKTVTVTKTVKEEAPKNVVSGMVGYGYTGTRLTINGASYKLETERDNVFGLQYQRNIGSDIYLGGFGLTNETYGVSVGIGF